VALLAALGELMFSRLRREMPAPPVNPASQGLFGFSRTLRPVMVFFADGRAARMEARPLCPARSGW